jgi:hypothetical protein
MTPSGSSAQEQLMKKFILSAAAVAALAIGGAAQADVIDSVGNAISRLFGVPYNPNPAVAAPIVGSYRDQWGRTVYIGANNQPLYVEQNGQMVPYASVPGTYAMAPSYDLDGDGVANQYDRYPQDARYR